MFLPTKCPICQATLLEYDNESDVGLYCPVFCKTAREYEHRKVHYEITFFENATYECFVAGIFNIETQFNLYGFSSTSIYIYPFTDMKNVYKMNVYLAPTSSENKIKTLLMLA